MAEKHFLLMKIPLGRSYVVCRWCAWMLTGFVESVIFGANIKIQWGNRSIYRNHWIELKRFLKEHEIETIIEYGAGLTTELMHLEGYKLTTLEPAEWYANLCRRIHKNIIVYDEAKGPEPLDQRFDCAVVDAPQASSARGKEMEHAIAHTDKYIYMHDSEQLQASILEKHGWTPMTNWSRDRGYHRFYKAPE